MSDQPTGVQRGDDGTLFETDRYLDDVAAGRVAEGDQLGELLSDATLSNPESETSKKIVLGFIEGYTDGLGHDERVIAGEDAFGYENSGLRSWAGIILSDHVDDLADSLSSPITTAENAVVNDGTKLVFNNETKNMIIGAGSTGLFADLSLHNPELRDDEYPEKGFKDGRAPALEVLQLRTIESMGDAFDDSFASESDSASKGRIIGKWAQLLDHLSGSGADMTVAQAEAMKVHNERMKGAIGFLVKDPLGLAAGPVKVPYKLSTGLLLDPALNALFTDPVPAAENARFEAHEEIETLVSHEAYSAISRIQDWSGYENDPKNSFGPGGDGVDAGLWNSDEDRLMTMAEMVIADQKLDMDRVAEFQDWVKRESGDVGDMFNGPISDIADQLDHSQIQRGQGG